MSQVGNTAWLEFPDQTGAHTRPDNWLMRWYRGNVTVQDRAYGIELKHAAVEDHGNWTVKITSRADNPQDVKTKTRTFEVIVAKGPRDVVFEGDQFQVRVTLLTILCLIGLYQDDVVQFEKDGENEISDVDIECKAVECSPPPTFRWMIGDRQQSHSRI